MYSPSMIEYLWRHEMQHGQAVTLGLSVRRAAAARRALASSGAGGQRHAVIRWLGDRLVRAGERLRGVAVTVTPPTARVRGRLHADRRGGRVNSASMPSPVPASRRQAQVPALCGLAPEPGHVHIARPPTPCHERLPRAACAADSTRRHSA